MNPVEQLSQLIRDSKLPDEVKNPLLSALAAHGINPTTKAMVRAAFDKQIDKKAAEAGIDPRNDEAYVDAVAELLKTFVTAEAELVQGIASIEAEAERVKQSVQPDIDAIEATKVKDKIQSA